MRGDTWTESTKLVLRGGVVYDAYGSGAKPSIDHNGESGEYTRVVELNYGVNASTEIRNLELIGGTSASYYTIEKAGGTAGGNAIGLIYNCDIYHSYSGAVSGGYGLVNYAAANEISHCYGDSGGNGFVDSNMSDVSIHNNVVYAKRYAIKQGDGALQTGCSIYNNYLIAKSGTDLTYGFIYLKDISGVKVYNNIIDARLVDGVIIMVIAGAQSNYGTEIYNNTIIGPGSSGTGIDTLNCAVCSGMRIKNNIIVGFNYPVNIEADWNDVLVDRNVFYGNSNNFVSIDPSATNITESDTITSDPNINYAGDVPDPFFALSSNSPCGDGGVDDDTDIPDSDYAGTARVNSQWIGAFEYDAGDSIPPVRSNGAPSGALQSGTTQTTMSLVTNENCECKYDTDGSEAFADMANTFSSTDSTSHSQTISGLSDGNSYTYYVRCEDESSNANTDDYEITWSVASDAETYAVINAVIWEERYNEVPCIAFITLNVRLRLYRRRTA